MAAVKVILVTVAGPGGHVDIGVRSDATPTELIRSLTSVLGLGTSRPLAEHRAPPRPGEPRGRRMPLQADVSLAEAGVADGDLVVFRPPVEPVGRTAQPATSVAGSAPGGALPSGQFAVRDYRSGPSTPPGSSPSPGARGPGSSAPGGSGPYSRPPGGFAPPAPPSGGFGPGGRGPGAGPGPERPSLPEMRPSPGGMGPPGRQENPGKAEEEGDSAR